MEMNQLEKEVNLIFDYLRHSIQIFLTWYTFFITTNILGLQWFISLSGKDKSINFIYYLFSVIGFLFVNILAFYTSNHVKDYRSSAEDRVKKITGISQLSPLAQQEILSASPFKLYEKGIMAIRLSLIAVSSAWVFLGIQLISQMSSK